MRCDLQETELNAALEMARKMGVDPSAPPQGEGKLAAADSRMLAEVSAEIAAGARGGCGEEAEVEEEEEEEEEEEDEDEDEDEEDGEDKREAPCA